MKKNTPLLDAYKFWMEEGRLPTNGLCNTFRYGFYVRGLDAEVLLFWVSPSEEEKRALGAFNTWPRTYWGYGKRIRKNPNLDKIAYQFTPLRQTLVLLMAALNDEL